MKAFSDFAGFADSANSVAVSNPGMTFGVRAETKRMHNARGLVMALTMSAACWGVIAMALLL